MPIEPALISRIRDSNLIKRCINFALKGDVKKEIHSFNTSFRASYKQGDLEISFADGLNFQGYGYLRVQNRGTTVFDASVNYADCDGRTDFIRCVTPPLKLSRPFEIGIYIPGNWEERLIA
jgi:hypothetical protein